MSTKVSPFMGGLGLDARSKLTLLANATSTVGNGTTTGNVHVGGNIGIGTTNPGANKLSVNGNVNITGTLDCGSL